MSMLPCTASSRFADLSGCKLCALWCADALLDLCHFMPWAQAFAEVFASKSWTIAYNQPALADESAERKLGLQLLEELALVVVRLRELLLNGVLPESTVCRLCASMPNLKVSWHCCQDLNAYIFSECHFCTAFIERRAALCVQAQR